ncbi:membrane protein insertion efficiency factor YidD [Chryseobacterium koreense]|uniref:Putative membrane protein insertion efficiency factor n=1 Tax=Chryseobacterium koreense CCUG 49689 TaxID=1304281 RepID=A0A0J7IXT0_9FLAO|nr:membrane protein insertion efficiency factor YidD [Chryseobacterium koreense]KMQ70604.1 alpha-hemolysin [Chryseobacterium koreense CCUG 49689]
MYFCNVLKTTFNKIISFPLVVFIRIYQWTISPLLPKNCRYEPTCSHYMVEALQVHGILKGLYLGVKRILRCHPWGGQGYDPVPPKK